MFQKLSQFVTFIKLTVVSTAASRPSHGMPQCAWFDEKILHGYTFDIQYITNESIRVAASASSGVHSTSFIYNKQPNEGRSSQKKIPREKSNEERARKREKKIYCLLYMFRSHIYTLRRTAAHIVNISKWMEAADEILISSNAATMELFNASAVPSPPCSCSCVWFGYVCEGEPLTPLPYEYGFEILWSEKCPTTEKHRTYSHRQPEPESN